MQACIACGAGEARPFQTVDGRDYLRCGACEATFLRPDQMPSAAEEHAHYLNHENDPDDAGYRRFLSRLAAPLLARLPPRSRGLDYGCGPGPGLAHMLREGGHEVTLYDPFFAPDGAPLGGQYDFVICSEVAEHFHRPWAEFQRLARMLAPGGCIAIMTCFQTADETFSAWHYRRDPTHVVFYREATLRRIARRLGLSSDIPAKDVAFLTRPAGQAEARMAPPARSAAPALHTPQPTRIRPNVVPPSRR